MTSELECSVGVIGAGYTAREHVKALQDIPGVHVKGIFSRTRKRAESLAAELGIPKVNDSVGELFRSGQMDLVVVAVSELSLPEVTGDCFQFPWTVLMEKPPGINLKEALGIYESARSSQRNALVALNRRFYSSTRSALDSLNEHSGPRYIHVQDQQEP